MFQRYLIAACACLLIFCQTSTAQSSKGKSGKPSATDLEFERLESIYLRSIKLRDFIVATQALYDMQALRPERHDLTDSLCIMYLSRGLFVQSGILAKEVLERDPSKHIFREILAQSFEEQGDLTAALKEFETLYKAQQRAYMLYKIATIQFMLKRFGECEASLNALLQHPQSSTEYISINHDGKAESTQKVRFDAAGNNILGVLYEQLNRNEEAKKYFDKALSLQPDFIMARQNLERLGKGK